MTDQEVTSSKDWKMMTLGGVAEITSSKRIFAEEYLNSGIPFYRGKEIIEKFNGRQVSTDLYISEEKFNEIKKKFGAPEAGEILLTSVGTLGIPYLVKKNERFYFKDGNLTWFRNFNGVDNVFLYYWIISDLGKEQLASHIIGSTQQALTIVGLKSIPVLLPPLTEQRAIAAVLSSLDDKIELLREQNKTLEATSQAIFKEWLVNFNFPGATGQMIDSELGEIPKGWKVEKLKNVVVENHRGISPSYLEAGIPVINQRCIRNGTVIEEAIQFHDNSFQEAPDWAYLQPKDILINSMGVGTLGRVAQVFIKRESQYLIHSCITILRADKEIIDPVILGYKIKSLESQIESMGTGTTGQTSLNNTSLGELEIIVPDKKTQNKLAPVLNEISTKADSNYSQLKTLSFLRDALLPKLMKGELRIKGF